MAGSPCAPDRTPSHHTRFVTAGVRCFERNFDGHETKPPVKLVVFDCDETLTLSTFMPKDRQLRTQIGWLEWADYISYVNFESPFLKGEERRAKLGVMLDNVRSGKASRGGVTPMPKSVVVLTRNESGAVACLNLLMMAKLADKLDAIWSLQGAAHGRPHGVFKDGAGKWHEFEPPISRCFDHKADVLVDVSRHLVDWFPQIKEVPDQYKHLRDLSMEHIVLVDDVRTNFVSPSPEHPRVLRYCKVARYDSDYRDMGFVSNMGGIGARNEADYLELEKFVREPWKYKEADSMTCGEWPFTDCDKVWPVKCVVFDFDETLSLYTFMPPDTDSRYSTEIGFRGTDEADRSYWVKYNFGTPYVQGDRVSELRKLLKELRGDPSSPHRTLAVLTKNERGAVAILNLLTMADLADEFSAVWSLSSDPSKPSGVYKHGGKWRPFNLPVTNVTVEAFKTEILMQVAEWPARWFPQVSDGEEPHLTRGFALQSIVLIDPDDEGATRKSPEEDEERIVRYCKVAHYDDEYLDQGLLFHMGGLGAKNFKDFERVANFVRNPAMYRIVETGLSSRFAIPEEPSAAVCPECPVAMIRIDSESIAPKPGRRRVPAIPGGSKKAI